MFGLRSARGRAILAGVVLVVVLAGTATVAEAQPIELAADIAGADRAAKTTLWLIIGLSALAFAVTAGAAALAVAVGRPLAALRTSARAITSGDMKARAKALGPVEVASPAGGFSEMTDALSAKTEEYIATTNLTGDIIAKLDKRGNWAFLNDAACQFYGRPREELLGTDSRALTHPDDLEPTAQAIRETRARKEVVRGLVNRQFTPLGTRVVEWNGYAFFDEDGQYAGVQITGRDITERKRAEEELRRREQEMRVIADSVPALFSYVDADGRYRFVNKRYEEWFGIPLAGIIGKHYREILGEATYDVVKDCVEAALAGQRVCYEQALPYAHGGTRWVTADYVPDTDEQGKVKGFFALVTDITERKRAEEALRESEERYRTLFEQAPDSVLLIDAETGALVQFNDRAHESLGYTREEFEKLKIPDFEAIESPEEVAKHIEKVIKEGADAFETKHRTKSGEIRDVEVRSAAVSVRGKGFNQALLHDITERKRAEEALRESEEKYRKLVQDSIDAIVIVGGLEIRFVNRAGLKTLGCEREGEVVGRPFTDFVAPEYRKLMVERGRAREKGEDVVDRYEFKALRKDGSEFDAEISVGLITYQGRVARQTIVRDISERKRAEEALQKARDELESRVERRMQHVNGYGLTFRELAVLHLVAAGESDKEIARVLGISPLTAHKHLANILEKMGAACRTEAGVRALREGLLD